MVSEGWVNGGFKTISEIERCKGAMILLTCHIARIYTLPRARRSTRLGFSTLRLDLCRVVGHWEVDLEE